MVFLWAVRCMVQFCNDCLLCFCAYQRCLFKHEPVKLRIPLQTSCRIKHTQLPVVKSFWSWSCTISPSHIIILAARSIRKSILLLCCCCRFVIKLVNPQPSQAHHYTLVQQTWLVWNTGLTNVMLVRCAGLICLTSLKLAKQLPD
jgi:hypothetical protein